MTTTSPAPDLKPCPHCGAALECGVPDFRMGSSRLRRVVKSDNWLQPLGNGTATGGPAINPNIHWLPPLRGD